MKPTDQQIQKALEPFGVDADARLTGQIREYLDVLLFWNQKISLTTVTRHEEILSRHFGESMFAARRIEAGSLLVDVGSGAGFPGLALKLAQPSVRVMLIEANAKKAVFLSEVTRKLGLEGVEVRRERMEAVRAEELQADYVTSRAVGGHEELLAWSGVALRQGGSVLLWLGGADCVRVQEIGGWDWDEAELIPGSEVRYLLAGCVSRGT
jgi:16S rRNA (guanine527-N7)-methyltransferase